MSNIRLDPESRFAKVATPNDILYLESEEVDQIWKQFLLAIESCDEGCMAELNRKYRTPSQKREVMRETLLAAKSFVSGRAEQKESRTKQGRRAVMRQKIIEEPYISGLKEIAKKVNMPGYSQFRDSDRDLKLLRSALLAFLDSEKCNLNVSSEGDFVGCRDELICHLDKQDCDIPRGLPKDSARVEINSRPVYGSQSALNSFAQRIKVDPNSLPQLRGSKVAPRVEDLSLDGITWQDVLDMKVKEMVSFGKKIGVKVPSGSSRKEALAIIREMFLDVAKSLPEADVPYGMKSPRRPLLIGNESGEVNLSLKSAKALHKIAKDLNVIDEKDLKKIDLIEKIKQKSVRAISPRKYNVRDYESVVQDLSVGDLRELAKAEGVRGYSRYSPRSLRRILLNKDIGVAGVVDQPKIVDDRSMEIPSTTELRELKVADLKEIAQQMGIENISKKKKDSLVRSIRRKARSSVSPALQATFGLNKSSVRAMSVSQGSGRSVPSFHSMTSAQAGRFSADSQSGVPQLSMAPIPQLSMAPTSTSAQAGQLVPRELQIPSAPPMDLQSIPNAAVGRKLNAGQLQHCASFL